ncbi:MAG: acyl-CoA-binding protein [Caldilineaceae bacterium]|nr:acyl-CoA-binding protein [Caldilineaceae bacterium]
MSDLQVRFDRAAEQVQTLPVKPDNQTMLKLYALYKQAKSGDVSGKRPGFMDMVGRAKYDAWAEVEGTSQEDAMAEYVAIVASWRGTAETKIAESGCLSFVVERLV